MFGTEGHDKGLLWVSDCCSKEVRNRCGFKQHKLSFYVLEASEVYVKSKDSFPCLFSLSSLIQASFSGCKVHCSDLSAWYQPQLSLHLSSKHPRAPMVPSEWSVMVFHLSILNLILSGKEGSHAFTALEIRSWASLGPSFSLSQVLRWQADGGSCLVLASAPLLVFACWKSLSSATWHARPK